MLILGDVIMSTFMNPPQPTHQITKILRITSKKKKKKNGNGCVLKTGGGAEGRGKEGQGEEEEGKTAVRMYE